MYKFKILTIGKTKETWLEEALEEYSKRLKSQAEISWMFAKDDEQLVQLASKEARKICLDASGKLMNSEEFSHYVLGYPRLCFIIGGADGLPEPLKKETSLSLSRLTFTHQIVRLILIEQIYRALEIAKGSPYHK